MIKSVLKRFLSLSVGVFLVSCGAEITKPSSTEKINTNWKFAQGDIAEAITKDFDDSSWEKVELPHDWSISKPFSKENASFSRGAWLPAGISFYRKQLDLSTVGENQKVFIHFEGAYRNAEVWINEHYLGKRPSGYAAFEYELTEHINRNKENVLSVKLDNSEQPGSRWYSGNGIYRDVFLKIKNEAYIPTWSTYVTTPKVTKEECTLKLTTEIQNTQKEAKTVSVRFSLLNADDTVLNTSEVQTVTLDAASKTEYTNNLIIKNPKLWSIENPNLYKVKLELLGGEDILDSEVISTGIRNMEYTVENGFVLNGKPTKIKGVCLHHGAGPLGAAARITSYERQIRILKEMGTNAVRTAHNPFDTEFLEVCDRMGMLVMNEAFDEWEVAKEPQTFREKGNKIRIPVKYYAHLFKEWSDRDLRDFVLRDRNHPSIFMWSIGNEIDQMHDESGVAIAKRLSDIVHQYDYRPATCGVNGYGWGKWPHEPAVAQMDIPGYNYASGANYDKEHAEFPNRKMIITEHTSAQAIANRGEYYPFKNQNPALQLNLPIEHPDTKKFLEGRNDYMSGKKAWLDAKSRPYVMGGFIWTGWDYLGEVIPYAWPARSSTFGVIDLAGFPKDGYYYYQSQWAKKPVTHIYPHWNWEGHEGEKLDLNVFSNADQVELIVNGESKGKKVNDVNSIATLNWEVEYAPGEVKAIGYTNGKKVSEEIIKTSKNVKRLKLNVTDNSEIVYVEVEATDSDDVFVPTADNLINFEVVNAKVLGVGNGNNRSHEPFTANYRKLYNGKCLVILEKVDRSKKATLTAKSTNIETASIQF